MAYLVKFFKSANLKSKSGKNTSQGKAVFWHFFNKKIEVVSRNCAAQLKQPGVNFINLCAPYAEQFRDYAQLLKCFLIV